MRPLRPRRPDDGRYLLKDQEAWRRLVRAARRAALAPEHDLATAQLGRAAEACVRAVLPPGHARRDSDFLRLTLEGRAFWTLKGEALRAEKARRLGELAESCAAVLDAPRVRPRADID